MITRLNSLVQFSQNKRGQVVTTEIVVKYQSKYSLLMVVVVAKPRFKFQMNHFWLAC